MNNEPIKARAKEALTLFERKERDNGEPFYVFKIDSINRENDLYKSLSAIIHESDVGEDFAYEWVIDALNAVSNLTESDEPRDAITELEPDIYTYNLTKWLNANVNNVFYLTQAMEEYEPKDGFSLLQLAQKLAMEEIMVKVVEFLEGDAPSTPTESDNN